MWTKKLIGAALGIKMQDDTPIHRFQFDSRQIQLNDCFIALPGQDRDGHDFIEAARVGGATCIIGQKNADFIVPDSYQALKQLAIYARIHSTAKRIAITGSVGKTSTTAFLRQILSQHHHVIAPQGSFNNHIGVPLTMTRLLEDEVEFGLFEVGTNHPGEISPLAQMISPDIAIITKIGMAHIGHFEDQQAIAVEKAQILYALPDDGIGIVPDDDFMDTYRASGKQLVMPDISAMPVLHQIPDRLQTNIAMAMKAAEILGVKDYDVSALQIPTGRGNRMTAQIKGCTVTIIDDAYNAAFDAMMASLDDLSKIPGRKIIVIGDMGEVGTMSDIYHAVVAEKINSMSIAHVIAVSPDISKALGIPQVTHERAFDLLQSFVQEGDTILFKGSHGSGVWQIAAWC